jgi:hypothetical protein
MLTWYASLCRRFNTGSYCEGFNVPESDGKTKRKRAAEETEGCKEHLRKPHERRTEAHRPLISGSMLNNSVSKPDGKGKNGNFANWRQGRWAIPKYVCVAAVQY